MEFTFSGATTGDFSASGLRAIADIQSYGGPMGVLAQVKVWGLSLAQMNSYSAVISGGVGVNQFGLTIKAGNLGSSLPIVADGAIWNSFIDLDSVPESAFNVIAAGIYARATPASAQSWAGAQNAEDLIGAVCAGTYTVKNNGAHFVLRNHNVPADSIIAQVEEIASAANFQWSWGLNNTISLWPEGATMDSIVIDVGPDTTPKMVGYPKWWQSGIFVTSLFNQDVQVGRQMNVTSSIPKANGPWKIINVRHELSTMLDRGPWFTTAMLSKSS